MRFESNEVKALKEKESLARIIGNTEEAERLKQNAAVVEGQHTILFTLFWLGKGLWLFFKVLWFLFFAVFVVIKYIGIAGTIGYPIGNKKCTIPQMGLSILMAILLFLLTGIVALLLCDLYSGHQLIDNLMSNIKGA